MPVRFVLRPLLPVLLAACAAGDGSMPAATVRDSAGIAIVENAFPDSAAVQWWSLAQPAELDIGGADAEEAYSLYQVTDALRLADGRVIVANGGASDIRYYAADGAHLHTSGRRGEGPGEFQRPQRLIMLPPDSVLVVDRARTSVLDAGGVHVRDFRADSTGRRVSVVGRLRDGRLIGTGNIVLGESIASGLHRTDVAFLTLTASGAVGDTIIVVPGTERTILVEGETGRIESIMVSAPPFAKSTVYAAGGDVLLVATQEAAEVRVFGVDGALRSIIRTGTPMAPVTDAHLTAWFERQREAMPADRREEAARRPEWPHVGKVVPPFAAIEIDDAGNYWFADYDDRIRTRGTWSVHDPEGRLSARVRMPERFQPMHIGADFVLGVERDDFDVEHVRLYRLVKT